METQPDSPQQEPQNTERQGFGLTVWAFFGAYSCVFTLLLAAAISFSLGSIIFYVLYPVMLLGLMLVYLFSFLAARARARLPRPSIYRCVGLSLLLTFCTAVVAYAAYSTFWLHIRYIGP